MPFSEAVFDEPTIRLPEIESVPPTLAPLKATTRMPVPFVPSTFTRLPVNETFDAAWSAANALPSCRTPTTCVQVGQVRMSGPVAMLFATATFESVAKPLSFARATATRTALPVVLVTVKPSRVTSLAKISTA